MKIQNNNNQQSFGMAVKIKTRGMDAEQIAGATANVDLLKSVFGDVPVVVSLVRRYKNDVGWFSDHRYRFDVYAPAKNFWGKLGHLFGGKKASIESPNIRELHYDRPGATIAQVLGETAPKAKEAYDNKMKQPKPTIRERANFAIQRVKDTIAKIKLSRAYDEQTRAYYEAQDEASRRFCAQSEAELQQMNGEAERARKAALAELKESLAGS